MFNNFITREDESGLWIKLPLKRGDIVYVLDDGHGNPIKAEVQYLATGANGWIISTIFDTGQCFKFVENKIGKTVFLSEYEARKAINKL